MFVVFVLKSVHFITYGSSRGPIFKPDEYIKLLSECMIKLRLAVRVSVL